MRERGGEGEGDRDRTRGGEGKIWIERWGKKRDIERGREGIE